VRTIHNLGAISQASGLGGDLGVTRGGERHFKIYIRNKADFSSVKQALERNFLSAADKVSYLRADICRTELNLEIEVTVLGVRLG